MPGAKNVEILKELEKKLDENRHFVIVEYKGLTVEEMTKLRQQLREVESELKVAKNTLFNLAIKNKNLPSFDDYLVGPNAFVFIREDAVKAAKKLFEFSKEHEALKIKAGFVEGHVFEEKQIEALSKLPSKEELIAKLLGSLKAPLYGLVSVAIGPVRGLTIALSEIAKQKEVQ
jgi:large subunit ribosomal protein L10